MRASHLYISVLPAAVMGLLGLVATAVALTWDPAAARTRVVLVLAVAAAVITLGAAAFAADTATSRLSRLPAQPMARGQEDVQRRFGELGFLIARGRQDLQGLAERVKIGETLPRRTIDYRPPDTSDPFVQLAYELQNAQNEAWNAVLDVASFNAVGGPDQRVAVFVNLARRMQSLSHRAIQGLDELENQVEDPDLLKGLFRVDHLSTRMRRQAESLAVIGGATSRRQWSRPVTVYEVLRSAIAEVEHYNRVKVVPPVDGSLHGSAVADVIHLLAELIENATKFAPPHTQVLIRVEGVAAGLAIEVEDRGLGIPRENQRRMNELLSDLERVNTEELLRDGRIGLLVVSALARRHNVRVQLQTNLYGGTQAVVVVPHELLGSDAKDGEGGPRALPASSEPEPALATSAPMPVAVPLSSSASASGFGQSEDTGPRPAVAGRSAEPTTGAWETQRPPLPRRHAQANLAPELRDAPPPQSDDQEIEHNPGLMAAFKSGMRSGQEDGGPADGTDSAG